MSTISAAHHPGDVFIPGLLNGTVAFVAGGSSGINLRIAQCYASAGARVAIVGRDANKAEAAAEALRASGSEAIGLSADVRDYSAIEAALSHVHRVWGDIDILVAGAAGNFVAPATGISSNGFRTVVEIDLIGTFNTVRAAFDRLRKPGSTVLAISAAHSQMPIAGQAHVCAAKAGVDMLMRSLSVEWGSLGIRCLGIAPGPVEGTEGMKRLAPQGERSLRRFVGGIPSGRQAHLDEIANLALFLVSGAADYINGSVIPIEGGLLNVGSQSFGEMLLDSVKDRPVGK